MLKLDKYTLPNHQRSYVVGDIHGEFDLLEQKLEQIGFNKAEDILFCVGDLVDRGQFSNQAKRYLEEDWFKSPLGNHDDSCIHSSRDPNFALAHTFFGGAWFYSLPQEEKLQWAEIFNELPLAIEITQKGKTFGIVHADIIGNDWTVFKQILASDIDRDSLEFLHIIKSRDRISQWLQSSPADVQPKITGLDQLYVGHTVFKKALSIGNINYLDTGACHGGELTIIALGEKMPVYAPDPSLLRVDKR